MATSGTVSQTTFNTAQVVDMAFSYVGVPAATISGEMIDTALKQLFLILSSYPTLGLQLWAVDKQVTSLIAYQSAYPAPPGTIDVQSAFLRSVSALPATLSGSDTQQIADLTTAQLIVTVGLGFLADTTTALTFSTSDDGLVWTVRRSVAAATYAAGVTTWFDLDPAASARYLRVAATSGLSGATVTPAAQPYEMPLSRIGQDFYVNLPNKMQPGMPVQFWLDRQATVPLLRLWPVPDSDNAARQLVIWRQRHIQDVGTMQQSLELPQRWFDAVTWKLALRLCFAIPLVDANKAALIKPMADEAERLILADERDAAPTTMTVNLSSYTGRR